MSNRSKLDQAILSMFLVSVFLTSVGCATVSSSDSPKSAKDARGIVYRMPMKWIRITLTVNEGKRTVTAEPTPAFGDPSRIYVAKFKRSLIANSDFTLNIDANGLLQTDQTFVTESQLAAGLAKLAEGSGMLRSPPTAEGDRAPDKDKDGQIPQVTPCNADGVYVWDLDPEAAGASEHQGPLACNVHVISQRVGGTVVQFDPDPVAPGTSESGLFYRQALTYSVQVYDDDGTNATPIKLTKLMGLPTKASPVGFVPISKTLFAKNTSTVTFTDGMPTRLVVDQDSEWLGFATLPVTVVNGYVQGLKAGLTNRRETLEEQVRYLDAVSKAKAQEAKTAACLKELSKESPDAEQVKALCGTPNTAEAE